MEFNNFFLLTETFVCGLLLAGSAFSAMLYSVNRDNRTYLLLSTISFTLAIYTIAHVFLYSSPTVPQFVTAEKFTNSVMILFGIQFLYYIRFYTGYTKNLIFSSLIVFFSFLFIYNFYAEYGLSYSAIHKIDFITLPWGEKLAVPDVSVSFVGHAVIVSVIILLIYFIQAIRYQLRNGKKKDARLIIIGFPLILITVLFDYLLIALDVINFPYLQEYSFLLFFAITGTGSFREILKNSSLEKALAESERKYRAITEQAGDIIFKIKRNGIIVYVSSAVQQLLGYSPEELTGENFLSLLNEDDYSLYGETLGRHNLMCRLLHKNGNAIWFESTFSQLNDDTDESAELIMVSRDISERKAYEEKILEQQTLLESIITSSPLILYIYSMKKGIRLFSYNHAKRILGYTKEEFLNLGELPLLAIVHPDDKKILVSGPPVWLKSSDSEVHNIEYRLKHKNGNYVWIANRFIVFTRDKQGNVTEFIGTAQDITARKEAETNVAQSNHRFKALSEASFEGIAMSRNGVLFDINRQFADLYEGKREDIIGKEIISFITPRDKKMVLSKITNEDSSYYRTEFINSRGEEIPVEIRGKRLSYEGNEIRISVFRDITEQMNKEKQLLLAKEKAENSEKLKTDFLTQISHEIRSPMHTILSFAGYLRSELSDGNNETLIECLDSMDTAGKRITRTIDLILNMAQIQTGNIELTKRKVKVYNDIIPDILREYAIIAKEKGNTFVANNNQSDDVVVFADEYTLKQIFQNLIDNAIKYTDNGTIIIESGFVGEKYSISVQDNGIGISEEYMSRLFSSFSQEEQGYTRRYDGNGLGLALVKKYCELNDIELKVESEKGKGSRFTLVFNEKAPVETGA